MQLSSRTSLRHTLQRGIPAYWVSKSEESNEDSRDKVVEEVEYDPEGVGDRGADATDNVAGQHRSQCHHQPPPHTPSVKVQSRG